jgi:hypothetical protein
MAVHLDKTLQRKNPSRQANYFFWDEMHFFNSQKRNNENKTNLFLSLSHIIHNMTMMHATVTAENVFYVEPMRDV